MNEREALQLVKRLLADAMERDNKPMHAVRDLAGAFGNLRGTVRTCLLILDEAEEEK